MLREAKEGSELDHRPVDARHTRMMVTYEISVFGYTVYKESGEKAYLTMAQKAHWAGETEFGEEAYDKFVDKTNRENGGFTF